MNFCLEIESLKLNNRQGGIDNIFLIAQFQETNISQNKINKEHQRTEIISISDVCMFEKNYMIWKIKDLKNKLELRLFYFITVFVTDFQISESELAVNLKGKL